MTDKVVGPDGSGLSEGLGLSPERAAFERWFRGRSSHFEWTRRLDQALKFGAPGATENESRYHEDATQEAWEGWQAGGAVAYEAARAEMLNCIEGEPMSLERAEHLARLWAAGKLIGGDAHAACLALLRELDRMRANVRGKLRP